MDSYSEIKTDDTRAAEVGVVTFEGREYASGGFSVDVERGRMIGYVTRGEPYQHQSGPVTSYSLTTWDGQFLVRIERTDRHQASQGASFYGFTGNRRSGGPVGFHDTKLQSFRTLDPIAGFYWYGRGLGAGMVLKLRRGRKADNA